MTFAIILLAALLSTSPREIVVTDSVDLCEHNFFYDSSAKLIFEQLIFYDFNAKENRYDVVAYGLIRGRGDLNYKGKSFIPYYNNQRRQWESLWMDGVILRRVTAVAFQRTWLQYDPEHAARFVQPENQRRGLSSILKREGVGR